jgi:hypothetical protein
MYIEVQAELEEERRSLQAHFTAANMSVHTKKKLKGTDLYKTIRQRAREETRAKHDKFLKDVKSVLKGKTGGLRSFKKAKADTEKDG